MKIDNLDPATLPLTGAERIPGVQGGVSKKITTASIAAIATALGIEGAAVLATVYAALMNPAQGADLVTLPPPSANGRAITTRQAIDEGMVLAFRYGAKTDLSAAFEKIKLDYPNGCQIYLGRGIWDMAAPVVFNGQRFNIYGAGPNITQIRFNPALASTCLKFNNPSLAGMFQASIQDIGFVSNNAVDKVAIEVANIANLRIERIGIPVGAWLGNSTGILTSGRQSLWLGFSDIGCARPVRLEKNLTWPTIPTDHFSLFNLELIGTSSAFPVLEIGDGVNPTQTTFRELAIVGGSTGILWNDTSTAGVGYQWVFEGGRSEQAMVPGAYSIDLGSSVRKLQSVRISNWQFEPGRNGLRLRNARVVRLQDAEFTMTTGIAIRIEFVQDTIVFLDGCTFQNGAAIEMVGGRCVYRETYGMSQSQRCGEEVWIYDDGSRDMRFGNRQTSGNDGGFPVTLANDATYDLCTNGFAGTVQIDQSIGTGALFYLAGGNNVTGEERDRYAHFSATVNTAGMNNVYWDAGAARYRLQNKTGATRTYWIKFTGWAQ